MKKVVKIMSTLALLLAVFALVSCGSISKDYAEKINQAAKDGKNFTIEQVEGDLGKEGKVSALLNDSGAITWTKKDGDKTKTIIVTFAGGKAVAAVYSEVESGDKD